MKYFYILLLAGPLAGLAGIAIKARLHVRQMQKHIYICVTEGTTISCGYADEPRSQWKTGELKEPITPLAETDKPPTDKIIFDRNFCRDSKGRLIDCKSGKRIKEVWE